MSYKVIYLTGAPAAGKTTVCRKLLALRQDINVFEYGKEMSAYLASKRDGIAPSQADLRGGTQRHVSDSDIGHVNRIMLDFVLKWRAKGHVVVDSHHVTKERYGFRVSPFSVMEVNALKVSEVWVLYTSAEKTIARIHENPSGRSEPNIFEADFHTFLQANLAIVYSMISDVSVFLFDSEHAGLLDALEARIGPAK